MCGTLHVNFPIEIATHEISVRTKPSSCCLRHALCPCTTVTTRILFQQALGIFRNFLIDIRSKLMQRFRAIICKSLSKVKIVWGANFKLFRKKKH